MIYGGVPVNSMKIKHYEMDTNSATVIPSDLQAGVTCFARGQKVTGTGKSFEFANYGLITTNRTYYVPSDINVIEIASTINPVKLEIRLSDMKNVDFKTEQRVATTLIDGIEYEIRVLCQSNLLKVVCSQTFDLQVFYGKDNYV